MHLCSGDKPIPTFTMNMKTGAEFHDLSVTYKKELVRLPFIYTILLNTLNTSSFGRTRCVTKIGKRLHVCDHE